MTLAKGGMAVLKLKKGTSTISFDSQNYVLTYIDYGVVRATHSTAKGAGEVGSRVINTTLDNRDVEIVGFIRARAPDGVDDDARAAALTADMKAKKAALYQMCEPRKEFEILPDGSLSLKCYTTSTVKFSPSKLLNNDRVAQFVIDARCYDPLFSDAVARYRKIAEWASNFVWPLQIPDSGFTFADRTDSLITLLKNDGDVETGLLINFTAAATVENPKLTNVATGEFIKLNRTLIAGESVIVNTNHGAEGVTSYREDAIEDAINDLDLDSSFLQAPVGTTAFHYTADSNVSAMTVTIYYFQRYLGV